MSVCNTSENKNVIKSVNLHFLNEHNYKKLNKHSVKRKISIPMGEGEAEWLGHRAGESQCRVDIAGRCAESDVS